MIGRRSSVSCGVHVAGLSIHRVENAEEVMGLLLQGGRRQRVGSTERNANSSRSHAIVQLTVSKTTPTSTTGVRGFGGRNTRGGSRSDQPSDTTTSSNVGDSALRDNHPFEEVTTTRAKLILVDLGKRSGEGRILEVAGRRQTSKNGNAAG